MTLYKIGKYYCMVEIPNDVDIRAAKGTYKKWYFGNKF
jgi:hypothetical protein